MKLRSYTCVFSLVALVWVFFDEIVIFWELKCNISKYGWFVFNSLLHVNWPLKKIFICTELIQLRWVAVFLFQFLALRRFRDIWTQYSSSLTTHFFKIAVSNRLILSSINHSALFMFPLIMSYYFHCLDGKQSVFEIMVRSIFNQPNSHVHTEHFEPRPFGKSLPNGLGFIHSWAIVSFLFLGKACYSCRLHQEL